MTITAHANTSKNTRRQRDVSQLDGMLSALWPEIGQGNVAAITIALKIMVYRAFLLDLRPAAVTVEPNWHPDREFSREEVDALIAEFDALPRPAPVPKGRSEQ